MVDVEELPNNPADDLADHTQPGTPASQSTGPPVQEEGYSQSQVPGEDDGVVQGRVDDNPQSPRPRRDRKPNVKYPASDYDLSLVRH